MQLRRQPWRSGQSCGLSPPPRSRFGAPSTSFRSPTCCAPCSSGKRGSGLRGHQHRPSTLARACLPYALGGTRAHSGLVVSLPVAASTFSWAQSRPAWAFGPCSSCPKRAACPLSAWTQPSRVGAAARLPLFIAAAVAEEGCCTASPAQASHDWCPPRPGLCVPPATFALQHVQPPALMPLSCYLPCTLQRTGCGGGSSP